AVEEVIHMGLVDSERVGIMGHSFGGFSTYGIITQTSRFKAAVALAGISDFTSLRGTFDARFRYQLNASENAFRVGSGWSNGTITIPIWKNPNRYLRNSPIMYADHVETPLLIIQGDLDYVPIQQGEEFFSALYELNKRAEFVRYWGESHVLDSPA